MTKYNYYEAVREDITLYIYESDFAVPDDDRDDELYDDLWIEDSVTGNGSGSYTFDRIEAITTALHGEYKFLREERAKSEDNAVRLYPKMKTVQQLRNAFGNLVGRSFMGVDA